MTTMVVKKVGDQYFLLAKQDDGSVSEYAITLSRVRQIAPGLLAKITHLEQEVESSLG